MGSGIASSWTMPAMARSSLDEAVSLKQVKARLYSAHCTYGSKTAPFARRAFCRRALARAASAGDEGRRKRADSFSSSVMSWAGRVTGVL